MTLYLTGEEVLIAGSTACGFSVEVCDRAQFEANVARPATSAFGSDAYPTIWTKAAALLHSFVTTQALVDGNKRTGWASAWLMLRLNDALGERHSGTLDDDLAEAFVLDVAADRHDVPTIGTQLFRLAVAASGRRPHVRTAAALLPEGFKFTTAPTELFEGVMAGDGVLADGSPRVYMYMLMDRGGAVEILLTLDQAKKLGKTMLAAANGSPDERAELVETLIVHGDIESLPLT